MARHIAHKAPAPTPAPKDVVLPYRRASTREMAASVAQATNALIDLLPERKSIEQPHAQAMLMLTQVMLDLYSCAETELTITPTAAPRPHLVSRPAAPRRGSAG